MLNADDISSAIKDRLVEAGFSDGWEVQREGQTFFEWTAWKLVRSWVPLFGIDSSHNVLFARRATCTPDDLKELFKIGLDYTLQNQRTVSRNALGGERTVAPLIFPCLTVEKVDEAVVKYVTRPPKHLLGLESPVVFDLKSGAVHYQRKMPWVGNMIWKKAVPTFALIAGEDRA